ncbi:MAG: amidohydrolase family protein [Lachnospiraceae bacterium]|nr:amidohydrolase family protein [Lachnospiraceae bacterium]
MEKNIFALKGDICYSKNLKELQTMEQGLLVCKEGMVEGVFQELPIEYKDIEVKDYGKKLIIPGLVDLHMHAPQYTYRGLHMDLELLEWLNSYTFPAEAKYKDEEYARVTYGRFVDRMVKSATTRACIFATVHVEGTLILMDLLEKAGMHTMVGKLNMDRNAPDYLREVSWEQSAADTRRWIEEAKKRFENNVPMLTPRFTPSCSDEIMAELKKIQVEYGLPFQSHLSENSGEIEWVKELCPYAKYYGQAYSHFGLFGGDTPTVMAHCIYSCEEEIQDMKEQEVYIAHCPESNMNVVAGIAPVRKYLQEGLKVGLGSDVAGGATENLFTAMMHAIQVSKLRWRLVDDTLAPLTVPEVFYMATKGGGELFGKVGSFEEGYEFDAVILDDSHIPDQDGLTIEERLERFIYLNQEADVKAKYIAGTQVL